MASSYSIFSFLLSLFLVFLFISLSSARFHYRPHNTTVDLKSICDVTINPQYCWGRLRPGYGPGDGYGSGGSGSGSGYGYGSGTTQDCYQLASVSVTMALNDAHELHDLIGNNLVESTNDKNLRTLYRSCAESYNKAIRDLEHVQKYLESGDYQRVAYEASHALEDTDECKSRFPGYSFGGGQYTGYSFTGRFSQYLFDSSRLAEMFQDFEVRCSILSNIVNYVPINY